MTSSPVNPLQDNVTSDEYPQQYDATSGEPELTSLAVTTTFHLACQLSFLRINFGLNNAVLWTLFYEAYKLHFSRTKCMSWTMWGSNLFVNIEPWYWDCWAFCRQGDRVWSCPQCRDRKQGQCSVRYCCPTIISLSPSVLLLLSLLLPSSLLLLLFLLSPLLLCWRHCYCCRSRWEPPADEIRHISLREPCVVNVLSRRYRRRFYCSWYCHRRRRRHVIVVVLVDSHVVLVFVAVKDVRGKNFQRSEFF